MNADVILNNEDNLKNEVNYRSNSLYVLLLRFYFIFFPMYPLISKFIGTTLWKDGLYLFFILVGFNVFIKNKFFIVYFSTIVLTLIFQILQGYNYFEYITWFLMGPPIFLYFRYIKPTQYKIDLIIIMFIMSLGFLFVFFYEIPTQDSMFFSEDEKTTSFFLRDGETRARFGFVSPMAFSQYSWFIAVTLFINNNFKKIVKYSFIILMIISIFYCNTRAGIFLTILTLGTFFYNKLGLYKYRFANFFTVIVLASIVILKNVISGSTSNHNNETLSDELRVLLLLDGLTKAKEHFLLGVSGNYFSPRAEDWYDFENSWLSLIVCFGVLGIILLIILFRSILFKSNNRSLNLYIIPWMAYSSIFPILQEPTAVFITWIIIGAVFNIDKWIDLNGESNTNNKT